MNFKLSKNSRSAMLIYFNYCRFYGRFIYKMVVLLFFFIFMWLAYIYILGILENSDRHIATVFIVTLISIALTYYIYTPIENRMKRKKLKEIFDRYVVSLTQDEEEIIKEFILNNSLHFDLFCADKEILQSLFNRYRFNSSRLAS